MAWGPKKWHLVVLVLNLSTIWVVHGVQKVPCYFIFGDSLYDNGNNNNLPTKGRANYPPYGVDFPRGPTGRFTNGRNLADILAQLLGFENFIPAHATSKGDQDILKGLNYASGGAGIREETATKTLGAAISMNKQLENHQNIVSRTESILGDKESASKHLSKCIYTVGIGSNDYINNYLLPEFYDTSRQYTPEQYAIALTQQYSQQLKTLYNYGARKIALFGLGPLGCSPGSVAMYGTNGSLCVDYITTDIQLFNSRLKSLVDDLNNDLKDAKFIYIDAYGILGSLLAGIDGFLVNNTPCCEVANLKMHNGVLTCIPSLKPCVTRSLRVFWDGTHPSEAANLYSAARSFTALLTSDAHPFDIRTLAEL
ncbi:GDSL esterase/lipase At1g29660-like [Pistacia vera]|uniref:GDSL esterase/lipase At1g29660-like n=1 Tax=Pistacia vera TaxID=55513 RepID=UPI001262B5AC|nr:GDSL esterase/lipase At1g29660-like [Pistacia vera]